MYSQYKFQTQNNQLRKEGTQHYSPLILVIMISEKYALRTTVFSSEWSQSEKFRLLD